MCVVSNGAQIIDKQRSEGKLSSDASVEQKLEVARSEGDMLQMKLRRKTKEVKGASESRTAGVMCSVCVVWCGVVWCGVCVCVCVCMCVVRLLYIHRHMCMCVFSDGNTLVTGAIKTTR